MHNNTITCKPYINTNTVDNFGHSFTRPIVEDNSVMSYQPERVKTKSGI